MASLRLCNGIRVYRRVRSSFTRASAPATCRLSTVHPRGVLLTRHQTRGVFDRVLTNDSQPPTARAHAPRRPLPTHGNVDLLEIRSECAVHSPRGPIRYFVDESFIVTSTSLIAKPKQCSPPKRSEGPLPNSRNL